ncbi:HYC_CC_PP family protein [Fulvivirga lutimaris]|uniref:HYC_CC_PP family protein n=1 Tax=Fulvivirga lutimaris TaxID=1819566 RepID=UPI0012BB7F13|nr:hypothetical protein [Fulvivirga lutimaris]MTI41431.1 hypothetical protein [Fulvivirga lutimaris]
MKRVLSIFLSFILLASTVNITLGTHYCGGIAVDASLMIGHQHLDCGMGSMDNMESEREDETSISKKCCDNDYETLSTDHSLKTLSLKKDFQKDILLHKGLIFEPVLASSSMPLVVPYYRPPTVNTDFIVLHQSFLI